MRREMGKNHGNQRDHPFGKWQATLQFTSCVFFLSLLGTISISHSQISETQPVSIKMGIPPKVAADYIHAVIDAHRKVYSDYIVDRLSRTQSLTATENWEQENTLLLPAQFLLAASQLANEQRIGVQYRLLSLWPINKRNSPRSEFERIGLKTVIENPAEPFTWIVNKGSSQYFQAIYPDFAVTKSCVSCHNNHAKSSMKDFQIGDVMGGIFINLPLDNMIGSGNDQEVLLAPEVVADYIHSILESHRYVYSEDIVDRLQNKNVLHATENWVQENALPLPAQFLMDIAQKVRNQDLGMDFRLISLWAINPQNGPANEFERIGLKSVATHPVRPFLGHTRLGKKKFFQAIYPDIAVTRGCVSCHNNHPKSPKNDFEINDVMGGIVVTLSVK